MISDTEIVTIIGIRAVYLARRREFCGVPIDEIRSPQQVEEIVQSYVTPLNVYWQADPFHGEWLYSMFIGDGLLISDIDPDRDDAFLPIDQVLVRAVDTITNLRQLCEEVRIDTNQVQKNLCLFQIVQIRGGL